MTQHTRRELIATASALVATGAVAGCGGLARSQGGNIAIEDDGFSMCNLNIESGSTVAWENKSDATYTLVSASDNWNMDAEIPPGSATNYEFRNNGVYMAELAETDARMKIAVGAADIEEQVDC